MSSNPRVPFRLASARRSLAPPEGKPLIVHIVVNVENWQYDRPMPRTILPAPHGAESVPDVPNFAWAEYGLRCGMPRLLRAIGRRGLPASCSINAGAVDAYPALAERVLEAGWELIGHGMHQRSLQAEASESELIEAALDRLNRFSGRKVEGWLSPGLRESYGTPDALKAAGVRYCCDWALDDLPAWMRTAHGPMIAVPYSLEVNDSVIYAVEKHRSDEMLRRLEATLRTFDRELDEQPRVLTLGLHPHLMGVPHRFDYLERMLDLLLEEDRATFMTGRQVADWFELAGDPAEFEEVAS